ncbi:D-alanine--D-alanine ligase [Paenibacillus urinalis]|uniref:D-alanine--D-alanine ligase n=1 Tax=Paenibacillus urinalis TaxID=521520 RepID=A0AAX3MV08_9BACL|nr:MULTISPECIES: D-alanine--D-alanine ligase [Paenibacillus]WDH80724.1 D-alanine--D-alanine ligase [Paenibacillus urinalis]WDH96777.1 D-alanine--D-alanine ligase [Paenibacillus urinalis]WDI00420.1 D-alanine--D-alanine ligase [Paenibacillus urinalis]GAK39094.1 D-alanine--D-alanine ligase [Paenibacillus sp. TCA20]
MKVGIMMGGVSSEREVSLQTGKQMMVHLNKSKYSPISIEIKDKRDLITKTEGIDIALLALHGAFGEDGRVQATLDTLGIPYTGSSVLSSSICMDKDMSKKLLRQEGVRTPDWIIVSSLEELKTVDTEAIEFPVVVKPNSGGSSIGTQIVRSAELLEEAVLAALRWDRHVMIEHYIDGEELTCSILDGELLPIISIKPNAEFFDYVSKYEAGEAEEQIVQLTDKLQDEVNEVALKCYLTLKCSAYARVDLMLKDGSVYVLEVNTLPGMTPTSLFPQSARAAGIGYEELLERIITASLEDRSRENLRIVGERS